MPIRLSLGHIDEFDDTVAQFAHQLGLPSVQFHTPSNLATDKMYWGIEELAALREYCDHQSLRIEGLENVPAEHFWKIQRGLPGRDEQIDNYHRTIRNMAKTGYDLLGFNFLPTYVWRTDMNAAGRGGASVTAFDANSAHHGNALASHKLTHPEPIDGVLDAQLMWDNYQYFLDAVLPVAEEEGVRLALHPDDPPVRDALGGLERIFISPEGIAEAHQRAKGSPAWGLNLCLGTVSEMGGEDAVNQVIDLLGPEGRIFYVHFRDVQGTVPHFAECFLGEGNFDPAQVIRRLHSVGFDGFLIDDHVPAMVGDIATWGDTSSAAYCSRGRAYAIGYLQGVLRGLDLD
ncbi:mannonate dehydratase [Rhodococcus marinonascens]|uniref:mannonate dehydratase n=1 Tax=Rhodococcus marinonascens TaxID=38311 RepID=UPI0009349721|nr:mannonate dehydratase [Rhodococcus marinonascens]